MSTVAQDLPAGKYHCIFWIALIGIYFFASTHLLKNQEMFFFIRLFEPRDEGRGVKTRATSLLNFGIKLVDRCC